MKWPTSLTLIRHGQSAYNILRAQKQQDPLYRQLQAIYKQGVVNEKARNLAQQIKKKYALGVGDYETPLTPEGEVHAARQTAKLLDEKLEDVGRTGMMFEGFGVDHIHAKLFPMHGTVADTWEKRSSNVEKYFEEYEL